MGFFYCLQNVLLASFYYQEIVSGSNVLQMSAIFSWKLQIKWLVLFCGQVENLQNCISKDFSNSNLKQKSGVCS